MCLHTVATKCRRHARVIRWVDRWCTRWGQRRAAVGRVFCVDALTNTLSHCHAVSHRVSHIIGLLSRSACDQNTAVAGGSGPAMAGGAPRPLRVVDRRER